MFAQSASINEFNLEELNVYNSIVACVANFSFQFIQCNDDITALGSYVNGTRIVRLIFFFLFVWFAFNL